MIKVKKIIASKKVPHIVEDGSDYIDDDSSDCRLMFTYI